MNAGAGIIWHGKEIPALLPGLTFDPDGHIYKVNGRPLKSVTQYTSKEQDHSFCSEVDMVWGSTVHDYLHKMDTETLDYDSPEFDNRFNPYLEGWLDFRIKKGWHNKAMLAEYPLYSKKYLFTGRMDRLFATEHHDFLIDIKSGAPSAVTGLQLSAYAQMCVEHGLTTPARVKLVEICIDREGKCRPQPFDFKKEWPFFLMRYSLTNHLNK